MGVYTQLWAWQRDWGNPGMGVKGADAGKVRMGEHRVPAMWERLEDLGIGAYRTLCRETLNRRGWEGGTQAACEGDGRKAKSPWCTP